MPETAHADSQQNKETEIDKCLHGHNSPLQVSTVGLPSGLRRILIVGGLLLVGLLAASVFVPNMADRIKFFTVNALSLLVLFAIIIQIYISQRQWEIMKQGTVISEQALKVSNRAYVGVHSITEDFEKQRIVLMVENTGIVPAENLKVTGQVWVIMPKSGLVGLRGGFDYANCSFSQSFYNTRLFRGNLKTRVTIDLIKITLANKTYISSVAGGLGTLWLIGSIEYGDGFAPGQITQFAFTYEGGGQWTGSSINDPEMMKKQEQAKEK